MRDVTPSKPLSQPYPDYNILGLFETKFLERSEKSGIKKAVSRKYDNFLKQLFYIYTGLTPCLRSENSKYFDI